MDYSKWGFADLKIACHEQGIEVTKKDTAETLREKLEPKPDKPAKPKR